MINMIIHTNSRIKTSLGVSPSATDLIHNDAAACEGPCLDVGDVRDDEADGERRYAVNGIAEHFEGTAGRHLPPVGPDEDAP